MGMECETCGAVNAAVDKIKREQRKSSNKRLVIVCCAVILCVMTVCLCALGCSAVQSQQETILEQQHALNTQYAALLDYVAGAETMSKTAEVDEGSSAVAEENSTTAESVIIIS